MEFFIRPRQDFSLSRMADALHCLSCCGFCPAMEVSKEKGKLIVVIRIEGVGDRKDLCERAIETLIVKEHFGKNNFKIIELPPYEASTEVF